MLELIIEHINNQLRTLDSFQKFFGLCEKITDTKGETKSFPAEYCTKDNYKPIDIDYQKGVVYHRLIGAVTNADSEEDAVSACDVLQTITYPMRLIASVPKIILDLVNDNQFIEDKIAQNIQNVLTTVNSSTLSTALKADSVMISVTTRNLDRYSVWADEYTNIPMKANFDVIYISVDYEIEITGTNTCFENAGCDPLTLLCDISKVTNENLTDPDIGLTTEQLCFPILPLYDFADQDTLDCLTEQQEIDLSNGVFVEIFTHNNGGGFDLTVNFGGGGTYDIDWGDGTIETFPSGSQSHLYTGAITRTIKMRRNLNLVTDIVANTEEVLTATLSAFTMLGVDLKLQGNPALTLLTMPVTSEVWANLQVSACNLTTVNLSGSTNLGGNVEFQSNPLLNNITFPASPRAFTQLRLNNCNFTIINVSMLTGLGGVLRFDGNSNLTTLLLPVSSTVITDFKAHTGNITGVLIIPMTGLGGSIELQLNPLMTGITLPASAQVFTTFRANACDLGYVDFTVLSADSSNITMFLQDNSMTVTEVNHILVDLDGTGWINGSVNIAGTNAAPDGASGGFDGLLAKANLIGNGWTVTTN